MLGIDIQDTRKVSARVAQYLRISGAVRNLAQLPDAVELVAEVAPCGQRPRRACVHQLVSAALAEERAEDARSGCRRVGDWPKIQARAIGVNADPVDRTLALPIVQGLGGYVDVVGK